MSIEVISASAGSGKTTRLAQLLLEAVSDGTARPHALLCTTFTIRAAAELQARMRARLLEEGKVQEADALLGARIGTVNSVCGRLAVQFALELGLSPELRVLDETAEAQLLAQALSSVVSPAEAEVLGSLRSRMVEFDWQAGVRQMVPLARQNLLEAQALREQAPGAADRLLQLFGPPLQPGEVLDNRLQQALEAFIAMVPDAEAEKGTRNARATAELAFSRMRRGEALPWAEWVNLSRLGTTQRSSALAGAVRLAAQEHDSHPRLHQDLRAAIGWVYELSARVLEAYAQHKRERGVMDFGDQERHAYLLLGRPEIQERLREELDLVLVDEFQDTNPLQLAIFLRLSSLAKRSVWVGDQKQSIYGFRGADPALMDAAMTVLCSEEGPKTLSTSFRSRPPLVEATSKVFGHAFADQGIPPERVWLRASVAEDAPALGAWLEGWTLSAGTLAEELGALASGVRQLLEDPEVRVRDRTSGEVRRPRAADVAVLCFTHQHCARLAAALEALGIPAAVPRSGLMSTHEGRAALAGLRLWVDGQDSLAAAELARLLVFPGEPALFLERAVLQPGIAAYQALEPHRRVRVAAEESRVCGALATLDAVLEALELREHCLRWGDSERRLANLEALRATAVAFATKPSGEGLATSTAGLIAQLETLAAGGLDAQAVEAHGAVVVSTWHAAKGLEWPITILHGGPKEPSALGMRVEVSSPGFNLADPLGGRAIRYWPTPYRENHQGTPLHQRLANSPEQTSAALLESRQDLRVLYVGWTRARDRLVLAAREGPAEAPFLRALREGQRPLVQAGPGELTLAGAPAGAALRTLRNAAGSRIAPEPGCAAVPRGPRSHAPACLAPSSVLSEGSIGRILTLGDRVNLRDAPDMISIGEAVHGFLAADRLERPLVERLELGAGLLRRWGVQDALPEQELVALANRLHGFIHHRWPGARWRREWPVQRRLANGTLVRGTVDLALELPGGWVVIDHKTFPGSRRSARSRAAAYAGQLGHYAQALELASGRPVLGTYLHLPISGWLLEIRIGPTAARST